MALGKVVTFKQEYKVESIGKVFGTVLGGPNNLAHLVVSSGYAVVKSIEGSKDPINADYDELIRLQEVAKSSKVGLWSDDKASGVRVVKWSGAGGYDPSAVFEELKAGPQPAIVEQFRDGASLRCYVPSSGVVLNVSLSGVRCPRVGNGETDSAEPFAKEALLFSEFRLLQRDVLLHVEGLDKTGNFFGTVEHPRGNLSQELLKAGLGKMVDWSAAFTSRKNQALLRAAENEAKDARIRLWHTYTPQTIAGVRNFTGRVIEVITADTLLIAAGDDGSGPSTRINLSSVKVPRVTRDPATTEPFAEDAFECTRSTCIGKKVTVSIEYKRDPPPEAKGQEERKFATVLVESKKGEDKNIAVELVSRGLAETVRHREGDERSRQYDLLLAAEDAAKIGKKAKWGTAKPKETKLVDLSVDTKTAKDHFPFLQRAKSHRAIVTYCFQGSRFMVTIPSENCKIMVGLAGVKAPVPARAARPGQKASEAEPCSAESLQFSHRLVMQREVDLFIEGMDQRGSIIGQIVFKLKGNRVNLAELLVEKGFAAVVPYSAENLDNKNTLIALEKAAKEGKIGLWEHYVEPAVDDSLSALKSDTIEVRVTHALSGGHFFLQQVSNANVKAVEALMHDFTAKVAAGTTSSAFEPKKNLLCAAKHKDGRWLRAKITSLQKEGLDVKAQVSFSDYGYTAVLPLSAIKPLDQSYFKLPPCAQEAVLGMIKIAKPDTEEGENALALLQQKLDLPLVAKMHKRDREGRVVVTLMDPADGMYSVNEDQVFNGFARVASRAAREFPSDTEQLAKLEEAQESAKKDRIGIFQFGDAGDSDDEEPRWGARK